MKKIFGFILISLILILALAACGGESAPSISMDPAAVEAAEAGAAQTDAGSTETGVSPTAVTETTTGNEAENANESAGENADDSSAGSSASLSTNYRDALPLEMQLAFGTMQLENTDLAITAGQAEALLPYWLVLQSLTQTGNAADAEINAVIKEIQNGMTGEQIAAIAAMELTEEKLQTMFEEGTINLGFGRGFGGGEEGGNGGGGLRPGGPGGGLLGGGRGGPGGLGGDPNAFATRQAELEASGENPIAAMMERTSLNMVIRLLETKTGEAPARGFGGIDAAFAVVTELTGLSEEELGAALAEGQTLGEILEASGMSADDAREAMKEALADVQLPPDQDIESWIDGFLSGSFGGGRQPRADQTDPQDQADQ